MEEDMAEVKKVAKHVNDIKDITYMSKALYKVQTNRYQDILKEQKTVYHQCELQREANKNLNESVQNKLKVLNRLLTVESTNEKAIRELIYNFSFAKKCALDSLRRMKINLKSCDEQYVQFKARQERLPSFQIFLQIENKKKDLLCDLQSLFEKINSLKKSSTAKIILTRKADHERILKLAQFMVHERSKILDSNTISANIDRLNNMNNKKKEKSVSRTKDLDWSSRSIFRKQIIDECQNSLTNIVKYEELVNDTFTSGESNTYFACQYLLDKTIDNTLNDSVCNEKQICFIDDKNVNEEEAQSMLFLVNPNTLKSVTVIDSNSLKTRPPMDESKSYQYMDTDSTYKPMEITQMNVQFISPPTQFRDQTITEEKTGEQEKTTHNEPLDSDPKAIFKKPDKRKRVAFNVPETDHVVQESVVAPEGDDNIDDMMKTDQVKKYKLDSPPQFTYANNNLQKRNDKPIKSKFFSVSDLLTERIIEEGKTIQNEPMSDRQFASNIKNVSIDKKGDALFPMELYNPVKQTKVSLNLDVQPIGSYSEDISSTFDSIFDTTIADDDNEYQTSIDTSLLLSPKSDMLEDDDKHNFLSGIKKKGLPFFGNVCSETTTNSDQSFENEESFSFNFGKKQN